MRTPRRLVLPVLTLAALGLSACASGGSGGSAGAAEDGALSVVASTNVYASIVEEVAGDAVDVEAIIDDPNLDPHSYEATAQDQLTLSKADLVVMNGGGYDAFMTTMLDAVEADPEVLDIVSFSGLSGSEDASSEPHSHAHAGEDGEESHVEESAEAGGTVEAAATTEGAHDDHDHADHDHGEFNEHVWYSVPTMEVLTEELVHHLSELLPDEAQTFEDNGAALTAELEGLHGQLEAIAAEHGGEKVAATEPVPLCMFEDMGLENITSTEFLAAVEEGNDVSPIVLQESLSQISDGEAVLLAYNEQTAGPQADELRSAAEAAGTPVVSLTETMPADSTYIEWMGGNITAVEDALGAHEH